MFKKTVLPTNVRCFGDEPFPVADERVHGLLLTEGYNRMKVVRHGD